MQHTIAETDPEDCKHGACLPVATTLLALDAHRAASDSLSTVVARYVRAWQHHRVTGTWIVLMIGAQRLLGHRTSCGQIENGAASPDFVRGCQRCVRLTFKRYQFLTNALHWRSCGFQEALQELASRRQTPRCECSSRKQSDSIHQPSAVSHDCGLEMRRRSHCGTASQR